MSTSITSARGEVLAYDQIEAAVKETARGRWFLEEFARRNRHAETETVLKAIDRLSHRLAGGSAPAQPDRFQADILEMARAIARTERDIRALQPQNGDAQFVSASDELDAVVATTEKATEAILSAAEKVQEQAWTIRERRGDVAECDLLDSYATEIYAACGFQDLTAQRIAKVIGALRFVDGRIKTMIEAAGLSAELDNEIEPMAEANAGNSAHRAADIWMSEAHQNEIDETFDFFVPAETAIEPTMVGAELLNLDDDFLEITPPTPRAAAPVLMPAPETIESGLEPAKPASRAKAKPAKTATTLASQITHYDEQPVEMRLRAFR